jgi:hypothetical protein
MKIHENRLSPLKSPPCEEGVLNELVSGNPIDCNQESDSPHQQLDELVDIDIQDTGSESTDDTWTPSIHGEDSNDDIDLEDTSRIWQEVPLWLEDFSVSFNKVDSDLEFGNEEEVKELKKRVLREFNNPSNDNVKKATVLNAGQV